MVFSFLAGASCIVIAIIPITSSWEVYRLVMGVIGRICAAIVYNGMFVWTAELYPTVVRGQGLGFVNFVSRVGGTAMPWIAKTLSLIHPILPFAVMGGMPMLNTAFLALLPETKDQALQSELKNSIDEKVVTLVDDDAKMTENLL